MVMQISGLPPDLLQFFGIAFFLSLCLICIFNRSDSKSFIHDVNFSDFVDTASYDTNDDDDDNSSYLRNGADQRIVSVVTRRLGDRCGICGNSSNSRCSRCKSVRYCSRTCQIKHWREGHKLECVDFNSGKVDSNRISSGGRRAPGHLCISSSEYHQYTENDVLATAKRSSKKTSGKETAEECPICISTIRTSKHSRPSLACETCKHKFHSSCISKWFSISKKSNCPLCGSLFKSGGGQQQSSIKKP